MRSQAVLALSSLGDKDFGENSKSSFKDDALIPRSVRVIIVPRTDCPEQLLPDIAVPRSRIYNIPTHLVSLNPR